MVLRGGVRIVHDEMGDQAKDIRSRTLIAQKQELWFCGERRGAFSLVSEERGPGVKLTDHRDADSLPMTVPSG